MGRPKGGKNKYWSKEEKLKLIKEHLDNNISTNEITTRENISKSFNFIITLLYGAIPKDTVSLTYL